MSSVKEIDNKIGFWKTLGMIFFKNEEKDKEESSEELINELPENDKNALLKALKNSEEMAEKFRKSYVSDSNSNKKKGKAETGKNRKVPFRAPNGEEPPRENGNVREERE